MAITLTKLYSIRVPITIGRLHIITQEAITNSIGDPTDAL